MCEHRVARDVIQQHMGVHECSNQERQLGCLPRPSERLTQRQPQQVLGEEQKAAAARL